MSCPQEPLINKDSVQNAVAYDLVKTKLSESEAEESTNNKAWHPVLGLVNSSISASESDNLVSKDQKRRSQMRNM